MVNYVCVLNIIFMSFVIIETLRAHHAPFPPCFVKYPPRVPPLRGGTIPPPTGNLNQKPCAIYHAEQGSAMLMSFSAEI